jgi:predicted nucleotidyltransferase
MVMRSRDIAVQMAGIYQQNPKVEAVLLTGSVSRGLEDKHSDIELNIFWSEAPGDADRMYPQQKGIMQ